MPSGNEKKKTKLFEKPPALPFREMGRLRSDRATRGLQEKNSSLIRFCSGGKTCHQWLRFWSCLPKTKENNDISISEGEKRIGLIKLEGVGKSL